MARVELWADTQRPWASLQVIPGSYLLLSPCTDSPTSSVVDHSPVWVFWHDACRQAVHCGKN